MTPRSPIFTRVAATTAWLAAGVGLAVITALELQAQRMPPTPPEVVEDVTVADAQDVSGREASFRILLFSDEFRWRLNSYEAIEDGWFGPVDPDLVERYGHVLVALRDRWAVMTRQFPRELTLIGMHGSLTPDEMIVPLFRDCG